jgi:hypothetical protein
VKSVAARREQTCGQEKVLEVQKWVESSTVVIGGAEGMCKIVVGFAF